MRNIFLFIFVVFFSVLSLGVLNAQTVNLQSNPLVLPTQMESLEEPITDDYILGPGDKLFLTIKGKVINVSYELVVTADGNIIVPDIGSIYASGISIKSLKKKIGDILPKYYRDAQFSLLFLSPRTFKVFITGSVTSPGSFTVKALTRLQEALNLAGGISPNGSYRYIQITRTKNAKKTVLNIDLYKFYKKGDVTQNPYLVAGDVIYVPVMKESVKVLGEVRNPGEYEIREGDKLKDIIEMAGGLTPRASLVGGIIEHISGEIVELDFSKSAELSLSNGDLVRIPIRTDRVYVLGQVRNPGAIVLTTGETAGAAQTENVPGQASEQAPGQVSGQTPGQAREGSRVSELISSAGGILPTASTRNIKILRGGKEIAVVDLYRILVLGDTSQEVSIRLRDGDIIFVPPMEKTVRILGQVREPGIYEIREGDRIKDVIIRAGGLTAKSTMGLGKIERITNGKKEELPFNVDYALAGDETNNIVLKNEDTIFIPELRRLVYVLGQVNTPGTIEYMEGRKLTEYISSAGGVKDRADLKKVTVIRQGKDKSDVITVNYEDIVNKGKSNLDIEIRENDIVYVPEVFFKGWQDLTQILMSIGVLQSVLGPIFGW